MLFDDVRDVIVETVGCEAAAVTPEARLNEDLGADSLAAMELIMALEEKLARFEEYAACGFTEIDYVLNQGSIENRDFDAIEREMTTIADFCRAHGITDKVIVEMCKLDGDDAAKRRVCEIALEAKPGFLKTSTGRSFGGAKLEDVRLMHEVLGDAVAIKAAGGIHNYEEACAFIEAGASALGASAGIAIVEGAPTDERR